MKLKRWLRRLMNETRGPSNNITQNIRGANYEKDYDNN